MFRLDLPNADANNPYRLRPTRRAPGNVPYVVDNLWEWRRPDEFPCRRHCVCVSPRPELARRAGGAVDGRVFRVKLGSSAKIAQIPQCDAREHPDVKTLPRLLLRLLGQQWLDQPATGKSDVALLWSPCLAADEVEWLFSRRCLADSRDEIADAITFWRDARLLSRDAGLLAYEDGEIFFQAAEWQLVEYNDT